MDINEVLAELGDAAKWPHIPDALVRNLKLCVTAGRSNRAIVALEGEPRLIIPAIDRMFEIACTSTRTSPDEVLRLTGFHAHDLDPTRIDAAFAQLRAIGYLVDQGFETIALLRPTSRPRADIRAFLRGVPYVLEVVTSVYDARHRDRSDLLADWIVARAMADKMSQLQLTADESKDTERVIVAVVDTERLVALSSPDDFRRAARKAWLALGGAANLRVCVITGRITLGQGDDNVVWPAWPA